MVRTCCVPLCPSNSRTQGAPAVTTFAFPRNEERKQLWLKNIPRENYVPGNSGAVCIKHFKEQFIIRQASAIRDDGTILVVQRARPKLSDDAFPSIFEDNSNSLPPRRKPKRRGRVTIDNPKKEKHKPTDLKKDECIMKDEREPSPIPASNEQDCTRAASIHDLFGSDGECAETQPDNKMSLGHTLLCPWCNIPFMSESVLQDHIMLCQPASELNGNNQIEENLSASETSLLTDTKDILNEDIEMNGLSTVIHPGNFLYSCEECPILSTSYFHLEEHKEIHRGALPIFVQTSSTDEDKPSSETIHKPKTKIAKIFGCSFCDEGFSTFIELRIHKQTHSGIKLHCCDTCGKCFQRASKLKVHKRIHTNERPYACEVCNARFTQMGNLNIHKRIHSGERPFECDVCGAAFMQPTHLKVHQRSHTGERPYSCSVCNATFSQLTGLILHKRSHTGERPFPCDLCDLAFNSRGDLKVHKRRHTGERPFPCDLCQAAFSHLGTLNVHKRRHTGKRAFLCDVCGAAFVTLSELKAHKRKHTGEQPYQCNVCGVAFTQVGSLNTHKKRHLEKKL